jgi:hypothetical protein
MTRPLLVLLLTLLACGDSEDSSNEDEELASASRLTRTRAQETGAYCCYENGVLASDAPAACRAAASCFFSETYSDVSPAGRGTMCGYLLCD